MPPVRELQTGLWHWQTPHPAWEPSEPWRQEVSSYAIDDGTAPAPLRPAGRARGDRGACCRTRDGDRADVPVARARHAEPGGAARRAGVRASARNARGPHGEVRPHRRAGCRRQPRPGLAEGAETFEKHWISAGDRLPVGVEAFPGKDPKDLVSWIESQRAVIAGDSLVDFGQGLEINVRWLRERRDAREGRRGHAPAARPAGRARAPDARGAHRPSRPRARALLSRGSRRRT